MIEEGLRLLGQDLQAGEAGTVDAIAVDADGRLVIVWIAPPDADRALARLLDLHFWVTDQRDLLDRLFASEGVAVDRPARFVLLSPVLSHALVRRLAVLPIDVTLMLARAIALEDGAHIIIEPAADILGLATAAATVRPAPAPASPAVERPSTPAVATVTSPNRVAGQTPSTQVAAQPATAQPATPQPAAAPSAPTPPIPPAPDASEKSSGREPQSRVATTSFWPDEVLPAEYFDEKAVPLPTTMEVETEDQPWPGSPEDRFPWELPEDPLSLADERAAPPEVPETVFETLTVEEMQEFARFDRQRRERNGRS